MRVIVVLLFTLYSPALLRLSHKAFVLAVDLFNLRLVLQKIEYGDDIKKKMR